MPVWDAIRANNHLSKSKPKDVDPASVIAAGEGDEEGEGGDPFADEIFSAPGLDVPMKAGDLLLGDSRMLHGTHPNASDHRRTCVTMWYLSGFASLPEHIRVGFANEWEGESGRALIPGMDDGGALSALIPREPQAVGREFARHASRGGGQLRYPTEGAQDFLGNNLPSNIWVEGVSGGGGAVGARL